VERIENSFYISDHEVLDNRENDRDDFEAPQSHRWTLGRLQIPSMFTEFLEGAPRRDSFFVVFFKYKRKAIGNILEMSQKLIQITNYSKKFANRNDYSDRQILHMD
jgi:hypothetical protein